ncbi:hypothetical protein BJX61DRAFT_315046 [Aspergillus egyptiacus]|nr:hypothetical protein BJX61DRAFT_315046 [Aspergillus egyptiacus]
MLEPHTMHPSHLPQMHVSIRETEASTVSSFRLFPGQRKKRTTLIERREQKQPPRRLCHNHRQVNIERSESAPPRPENELTTLPPICSAAALSLSPVSALQIISSLALHDVTRRSSTYSIQSQSKPQHTDGKRTVPHTLQSISTSLRPLILQIKMSRQGKQTPAEAEVKRGKKACCRN